MSGTSAVVILVIVCGWCSVELDQKRNEVRAEQVRKGVVGLLHCVGGVVRLTSEVRDAQDRRLASVECQCLLEPHNRIDCSRAQVLAVVDSHCYQDTLDLSRQWCVLEDLLGVVDVRSHMHATHRLDGVNRARFRLLVSVTNMMSSSAQISGIAQSCFRFLKNMDRLGLVSGGTVSVTAGIGVHRSVTGDLCSTSSVVV